MLVHRKVYMDSMQTCEGQVIVSTISGSSSRVSVTPIGENGE